MSPWRWWVDACRRVDDARRLIGEALTDHPDIGTDDDGLMDLSDAVQDYSVCTDPDDPNACGCRDCEQMVARIRAVLADEFEAQAQRQIAELDYAFGLPAYRRTR